MPKQRADSRPRRVVGGLEPGLTYRFATHQHALPTASESPNRCELLALRPLRGSRISWFEIESFPDDDHAAKVLADGVGFALCDHSLQIRGAAVRDGPTARRKPA